MKKGNFMLRTYSPTLMFFLLIAMPLTFADNKKTTLILPAPLKAHVIENMKQNLAAFDEILESLANNKLSHAAKIAETYLGHKAKFSHNKSLINPLMPFGMQQFNKDLIQAADHFSQVAKTGDTMQALTSFRKISDACVLCHSAYKF